MNLVKLLLKRRMHEVGRRNRRIEGVPRLRVALFGNECIGKGFIDPATETLDVRCQGGTMGRPNSANHATKAVGIWIRVSTEDQAKGESPQHHEKRARYYAEAKGWNILEVYHLEGVSGKSVAEHPEAKRMLADVKRGRINGLIFSKLARLARNTRELLDFADFFRSAGADLISLQESIDTSTPAGRLFYTMIAAMAQWEREEISSRVAASVSVRAKLGKTLGGQAPFGYQWVDKRLVPNPDEAPVRRRIHELFLTHRRRKTVARLLNESGFRTRNGSLFSDTTILRLLEDPTAKGKHRLNYTSSRGKGKGWDVKSEDDWEFVEVEPVVSAEIWDQCNAILDNQREGRKPPAKRPVQLFAGIAYCDCGARMQVPSNSPKYICTRPKCRNKILVDDLEAIFVDELKGVFLSRERVEEYVTTANEGLVEKERLLAVKKKDLEKTEKEIERVYRLYVDEQLTPAEFGEFHRPLQERKKTLIDEIPKAEAEADIERVRGISADEILSEAGGLYGRWPSLSREEKRRVVESITERIIVGRGTDSTIEIQLAYLPSSEELTERQRTLMGSWRLRA